MHWHKGSRSNPLMVSRRICNTVSCKDQKVSICDAADRDPVLMMVEPSPKQTIRNENPQHRGGRSVATTWAKKIHTTTRSVADSMWLALTINSVGNMSEDTDLNMKSCSGKYVPPCFQPFLPRNTSLHVRRCGCRDESANYGN